MALAAGLHAFSSSLTGEKKSVVVVAVEIALPLPVSNRTVSK